MSGRACHRYDRAVASRQWWWLTIIALAPAGCSSSNPSADPQTSLLPSPTQSIVATEPTGVPGLIADDPFCSAWAGYVGTLQALGIAASFGDLSSDRLAVLELTSAARLVEVTAAIDGSWPDELAAERPIVLEQRIGPYARRARRAVEALTVAGVTPAEQATLSAAWQAALSARDPEEPVIDVPSVADDLQFKIDVAAVDYDSVVTPFAQDPSLVVDAVQTPATDAYLVATCPDLASSGVGDAL